MPDPDLEKLLARSAQLQGQVRDLTVRLADMRRLVCRFEQCQFGALGKVLAECLHLRAEFCRLKADRSGAGVDQDEARLAAEECDAYRRTVDASSQRAQPSLDEHEQDELRRLYKGAVMRCHPDRVDGASKESAHELFLNVQEAYRTSDLAGLRRLLEGLDGSGQTAGVAAAEATAAGDAVRRRVSELQNQVADLILAVQTLQLDAVYRQARSIEDWDEYFAHVRARFEDECGMLRARIRTISA